MILMVQIIIRTLWPQ